MLITDFKASFKATEAIPAGCRVKYVAGGGVALASATEKEIGVSLLHNGKSSYAIDTQVSVHLRALPVLCSTAGTFADGASVQRMASGQVDDTGSGAVFGIALEASTASGEFVMVLPLPTPGVGAIPADIASSTNILAVPGSFADLAAVRTYLNDAAVMTNIESRLDGLEAKVNALLAALR